MGDTEVTTVKYAITVERSNGLEIHRLRIWNWENTCIYNVTRFSDQGARIALMQWETKHGVKK